MTTPLDDLILFFVETWNVNLFSAHMIVFFLALSGIWQVTTGTFRYLKRKLKL